MDTKDRAISADLVRALKQAAAEPCSVENAGGLFVRFAPSAAPSTSAEAVRRQRAREAAQYAKARRRLASFGLVAS